MQDCSVFLTERCIFYSFQGFLYAVSTSKYVSKFFIIVSDKQTLSISNSLTNKQ